jgi:hypothetical protein
VVETRVGLKACTPHCHVRVLADFAYSAFEVEDCLFARVYFALRN